MILYGISTCDTCKKALKELERAGKDVTFRDIRSAPLIRCDQVQWSLFGISLAGFNALFSLTGAIAILAACSRIPPRS